MPYRSTAMIVIGLMLFGAAGCGDDDGASSTSAPAVTTTSTAPATTAAPSTTQADATTQPEAPVTWLITADAVGPVELGMPVPALGPATGISWVLTEPGAPDCVVGTALDGAIRIQGSDVVTDVTVAAPGVAETAEGITVGDSKEAVLDAYGSRAAVEPGPYFGEVIVVDGPLTTDYGLAIQLGDNGIVVEISIADHPGLIEGGCL